MKTYIPYSLILAAASLGMAFGQTTAYTTPVGYETISLTAGFNYMGVRLHNPIVDAGLVATISATQMTSTSNFGAILTGGAGTTYIVEFLNGSGAIQEVTGASASGSTLLLPENVTALVSAGAQYQIRAASTIASIFGATNSAGLTPGFSGPGDADVVYVPNGVGGYTQYFYDEDNTSWANALTNSLVNASQVPLVYTDGILVFKIGTKDVVVSGEVKKKSVLQSASAGFNTLGTIFPVGTTLATAFSSNIGVIHPGFSGPGDADIVYVPNGATFTSYFYDEDNSSWANASTNALVNASTVNLPSAVLYFNAGSAINLLNSAPAAYSSL